MANIGSDIVERLTNSVGEVGSTVVKSVLNALYPNEFELYLVSLELTNAEDITLDYFTFPINPSSITKTETFIKDIDRAYGAIVVNKSGKFAPQDIILKGNFGKEFKMIIREKEISFKALVKANSRVKFDGPELMPTIKNGYGCFKVLQNICRRSDEMEDGKPRRLYFHNFMLGESYLVEVVDFQADQTLNTNMLWDYTLRLKILSPLNLQRSDRVKMTLINSIQKTVTSVVKNAKDILVTNL